MLLVLVGCSGGPSPGGALNAGSGARSPGAERAKKLVVSSLSPITVFGAWDTSNAGGTFALHDLHTSSLVTTDRAGNLEGRLLSKIPSLDDSTLSVLPDGRMQTTFSLRPNVKWHDGAPFTAEDLAFTLQVYRHPEVALQGSAQIENIERIDVTSPTSALVTWKTTFYLPFRLGLREFWPLPKHVLGSAFEGDKRAFSGLPYWTTEYINTGPFRLVDYGLGEQVVFERFDDYFLGRPKLQTIEIRVIGDANVLLANLRAEAVDMSSSNSLPGDLAVTLNAEWRQSGEGSVVSAPGSFRFEVVQFNPQHARPPELSRDVRTRRGLLMAIDRETLGETLLPGVPYTTANSYLPDSDPRTAAVGRIFDRYRYNPTAAAQQLAEAGWTRGADGQMVNQTGQHVEIAIRSQPGNNKEAAIIAQYWRDIGIQVIEEPVSSALARDAEHNATFSAFSGHANGSREGFFRRLLSHAHATPQNRYAGANTGSYTNLRLDQLNERLQSTPDEREQTPILRELGEILATELPAIPSHFTVTLAAVRRGVRALVDDFAGSDSPGSLSRNAHLWDRD